MGIIKLADVENEVSVDETVEDLKICAFVKAMADILPVTDERKELFRTGNFVIASNEPDNIDLFDDANPVMHGEHRVLDFAEFGISIEQEDDEGLLTLCVNKQKVWTPSKKEVQDKVAMVKEFLLENYPTFFPEGKRSSDAFERIRGQKLCAEQDLEDAISYTHIRDEKEAAKVLESVLSSKNIKGITEKPYKDKTRNALLARLVGFDRDHAKAYLKEMYMKCCTSGVFNVIPNIIKYVKKPLELSTSEERIVRLREELASLPTYNNVAALVPDDVKRVGCHDFLNTLFFLTRRDESCSELYRREWDGEDWDELRSSHQTDSGEYLIATEERAEEYAREYLLDSADELMGLYDVPEHARKYINREDWVDEVIKIDKVPHVLATYDGDVTCTDDYEIYRIN